MLKVLGLTFEIIAFLVSVFCFKKNKGSFIQWMSLFLFYIIFTEASGYYIYYVLKRPNSGVYLFYHVVSTCFYTYIFYQLLNHKKLVKTILSVVAFTISVLMLSAFFFVKDNVELLYRFKIIIGIYLSVVSCYYLYCEFMEDDLEELLLKNRGSGLQQESFFLMQHTVLL